MKDRIINIISVLMILAVLIGYAWVFSLGVDSERNHEKEMERREYIKFQKDSLELELLKKNIK